MIKTTFPITTESRIFMSGGTGFFGRAVLRVLEKQWRSGKAIPVLTVLSRDPVRFQSRWPMFSGMPWLEFVKGDILKPGSLPSSGSFSHVLHAAGDSTDVNGLNEKGRFSQIVDGTRNLLEWCSSFGNVRFLLTSSGGVYGALPRHMDAFPEDWHGVPDSLNPKSNYGIAKRAAELLCSLYDADAGLDVIIARCFSFVGRDLPIDAHFAIGNFIRDALYEEAIYVNGDGKPLRSYMDQDDLARWLLEILQRGRTGQAYNVGSDEVLTISELAHLVRDIVAPEKSVIILGEGESGGDRNRYIPDISKAQYELKLELRKPLSESIRTLADVHRRGG